MDFSRRLLPIHAYCIRNQSFLVFTVFTTFLGGAESTYANVFLLGEKPHIDAAVNGNLVAFDLRKAEMLKSLFGGDTCQIVIARLAIEA